MKEIKHEGCYKCGDKDVEFLYSVALKNSGNKFGIAICMKCLAKEQENNNVR